MKKGTLLFFCMLVDVLSEGPRHPVWFLSGYPSCMSTSFFSSGRVLKLPLVAFHVHWASCGRPSFYRLACQECGVPCGCALCPRVDCIATEGKPPSRSGGGQIGRIVRFGEGALQARVVRKPVLQTARCLSRRSFSGEWSSEVVFSFH